MVGEKGGKVREQTRCGCRNAQGKRGGKKGLERKGEKSLSARKRRGDEGGGRK